MERRRPPCRRQTERRALPLQLEILAHASLYASYLDYTVIPLSSSMLCSGGMLFIILGSWAAWSVDELTLSRPQREHTAFQAASQGGRRCLTPQFA